MKILWSLIKLLFELVCYAALVFVLSGIVALIYVQAGGLCPRFDTGSVSCVTPQAKSIANWAMTVLLLTVFTGFPGLLAIAGVIFGLKRIGRWRGR